MENKKCDICKEVKPIATTKVLIQDGSSEKDLEIVKKCNAIPLPIRENIIRQHLNICEDCLNKRKNEIDSKIKEGI